MMGQQSGATSGLAINSLVEQGMNTLAEINDNYRYARRLVGEMLFDLIQQTIGNKQLRVTIGEGKSRKIIPLNMPSVDPETGQQIIVNDVTKVKAKIVLDDIPSTPTYRMQQLQMITEITKSLPPELQAQVVDFVIEATDMPNRHKIANRLRSAIGIKDPEQQQAEQQAQAQAQQQAEAFQQKAAVVDLAEKAARIRKLNAEADKLLKEISGLVPPPDVPVDTPAIGVHAPEIQ
jgi:hypothetical protein